MTKLELEKIAVEVRKGIITGVHSAKSGHPGGSLSAAEIFTYLYFVEMNVDPKNPKDPNRDRFVLSKGHVAPGLYATQRVCTYTDRIICVSGCNLAFEGYGKSFRY